MTMISLDDTLDASYFRQHAAEQKDFCEGERREVNAAGRSQKKALSVKATPSKEEEGWQLVKKNKNTASTSSSSSR